MRRNPLKKGRLALLRGSCGAFSEEQVPKITEQRKQK